MGRVKAFCLNGRSNCVAAGRKNARVDLMSKLAEQIAGFEVPGRGIAIWFLGQNGWIVKSPGGTVIAVDPYLSDAIKGRRPELDTGRRVPIAIQPDRLKVDLYLCTHSHADHACPETIAGALHAGTQRFAGPAETHPIFARAGVPEHQRQLTFPKQAFTVGDITVTGTFALPTDATDLNHMGFVISVADGPRFYITGDTAPAALLRSAGTHAPQLMAVCINGGYGNLSHWEAAQLVRDIDPEIAFPCHFDMFADNSCPPHLFKASLVILGIGEKFRLLDYEVPFLYTLTDQLPREDAGK
jgi:L-ascorbate 6-phosphate lactonase